MRGRRLSLVGWHHDGKTSDSKTADDSADHHDIPDRETGGDLEDVADAEDDTPETDGVLAAETAVIGDGPSNKSADEGPNRKHSDEKTGADVAEFESLAIVGELGMLVEK